MLVSELVVLVFEQDVGCGQQSAGRCVNRNSWIVNRGTCRILPRRIRARIQSHQSKCRSSGSPSLGHPDLPLRLDRVDDQLRKGVAVALQRQHVAVAGDTEVAQVDEVGFSSVRVGPIGDRFVYRTRVTEIVCADRSLVAAAWRGRCRLYRCCDNC